MFKRGLPTENTGEIAEQLDAPWRQPLPTHQVLTDKNIALLPTPAYSPHLLSCDCISD
jgi:hypothetical protein